MFESSLPVELLARIQPALPKDEEVYLVGGAVRDALLERPIIDLDFTIASHAIVTARHVANQLKADFYPLDASRDIGRVIVSRDSGKRWTLDFAAFQGQNLESDLRNRDFTANAMAVSLHQLDKIIDPLGGTRDLHNKTLVPCSSHALRDDPIRIPRAFRLASELRLAFSAELKKAMREAIPLLPNVSQDRLRDELFRILAGGRPVSVFRGMDAVGAFKHIFPEVEHLKSVEASPPHTADAFSHSLDTVHKLHQIIEILSLGYKPEVDTRWTMGLISLKLGRYRQRISEHLENSMVAGRTYADLLLFAALHHDIGKPATQSQDTDGITNFYSHEFLGAQMAFQRARILRLSRQECERIHCVVKNHMRPLFFAQSGVLPTRRSIYRFFNATGEAGLEICLLSLADVLAIYGFDLPRERWILFLDITRSLFEGWWDRTEEVVSPPRLVNGRDLMDEFQIKPGPLVGEILNLVREGQASGEIHTKLDALNVARVFIEGSQGTEEK